MKLREQLIITVTDRSFDGVAEIKHPDVFSKYVHRIVDAILGETQLQELSRLQDEARILKDAFILLDSTMTNYTPEQMATLKRARELSNDDD